MIVALFSAVQRLVREKVRDVGVKVSKTPVEGRDSAVVGTGQAGEVGVGDLPVSDYALHAHPGVAQPVNPEVVPGQIRERRQHLDRFGTGQTSADEETDEASL